MYIKKLLGVPPLLYFSCSPARVTPNPSTPYLAEGYCRSLNFPERLKSCYRSSSLMNLNLRSILLVTTVGVVCYIVNYSFLSFMLTNYPWVAKAFFGKGSWWLDQPIYVKVPYVLVIAPLYEELIHRRIVMQFFVTRGETELGMLISSITFALHHYLFGWGWFKAVDMFFVGLVFGAIYIEYRFTGSWLCHTANNAMAAAFMIS
ncbi:MAG: hypothetical protein DRO98_00605 [Archaeoglobales archaeon]|nr:MAG: hypothetical protein DRO98_00605 [Archaeoglobales archaeon]